MVQLELLADDVSEFDPALVNKQRDLLSHRHGLVSALYADLQDLASKVQSAQVNEMQHEAEIASFFTSAKPVAASTLKPPPMKQATNATQSRDFSLSSSSKPSDEHLDAEADHLLSTFTSGYDQINETKAKMEEVSGLVGLFATKLAEQQDQVEQIHDLAEESTSYVESAEKHLTRAVENSNAYRFYVVCWFVGSALILLIFDFIDAHFSLI